MAEFILSALRLRRSAPEFTLSQVEGLRTNGSEGLRVTTAVCMIMNVEHGSFDHRAFRFGTVLGGLALLAAFGAFKNFMALFSGEREGYVLFGWLGLQYSASQIWFGYAFTGLTGQLLRIPHIFLYSAAAYGLWTRRKWAWYLVLGYLLYVIVSLGVFTLFYPWGWLTGRPYPQPYLSGETRFFFESLFIIAAIEWYLYRRRDWFGVGIKKAVSSQ